MGGSGAGFVGLLDPVAQRAGDVAGPIVFGHGDGKGAAGPGRRSPARIRAMPSPVAIRSCCFIVVVLRPGQDRSGLPSADRGHYSTTGLRIQSITRQLGRPAGRHEIATRPRLGMAISVNGGPEPALRGHPGEDRCRLAGDRRWFRLDPLGKGAGEGTGSLGRPTAPREGSAAGPAPRSGSTRPDLQGRGAAVKRVFLVGLCCSRRSRGRVAAWHRRASAT